MYSNLPDEARRIPGAQNSSYTCRATTQENDKTNSIFLGDTAPFLEKLIMLKKAIVWLNRLS